MNKKNTLSILTATIVCFVFYLHSVAYGSTFTAITWGGEVLNIDSETTEGIHVGDSGFSRLNSLAMDSSGRLFTAMNSSAPYSVPSTLIKIDSISGVGTEIATLSNT